MGKMLSIGWRLGLLCMVAAGACSQASPPAAAQSQPAKAPLLPPVLPTVPAGAGAPAKNYLLRVDSPAQAQVGTKSQFRIVLEPKAGFHVNEEFPFEIAVVAPEEVAVDKVKLGKGDAEAFAKAGARFVVGFMPKRPGEAAFSANVRFAVCTDQDCWPAKETLRWKTTLAARIAK